MTEQNNAAAERSAHVERGHARRIPGESFLVEVSPGVFQIKALVEAIRERDEARAEVARCEASILAWLEAVGECNKDRHRLREALGLIGRGDIPIQYPNTASGYRRYAAHVFAEEFDNE